MKYNSYLECFDNNYKLRYADLKKNILKNAEKSHLFDLKPILILIGVNLWIRHTHIKILKLQLIS